jgi:broad specificity phosphatase PhoE
MVRHTTVDVPPGMCYGRTDVALRDSFAEEAAVVREALSGVRFDSVWSSPLSRCTRLAGACGYRDPRLDDRLLEINFGEWEGRLFDEIADPRLRLWYADYLNVRPTGGESFSEQCARVAEFLDELRGGDFHHPVSLPGCQPASATDGPSRRALVFTHGGVMLAAMIHTGLVTPAEAVTRLPPHGSILKLG